MSIRKVKAGFVGFGEVNSPRDLIEQKVLAARRALEERGMELVATAPVSDDPERRDEQRARPTCRARTSTCSWCAWRVGSPRTRSSTSSAIGRTSPWSLWGLTGYVQAGSLVTTADQAGTSALRDPMEALGFRFKYVYDTYHAPYGPPKRCSVSAR